MALLQEIKVPLLAVNDTMLTVVEMNFASGDKVKKGDLLLVFETSKTTYDVEAEADGYVQYFCETGKDYEVNTMVAKIGSELEDLEKINLLSIVAPTIPQAENLHRPEIKSSWKGDTVFSDEALLILKSANADISVFKGQDFVSKADAEEILGLKPKQSIKNIATDTFIKQKKPIHIDNSKIILEKLSSSKKREIEYLSDIQSTGLTSTINIFIETNGIFIKLNSSLKYLKNSLLPLIVYETARLLKKHPLLNAYFSGNEVALYKDVNIGFAIDIDKGLKVLKLPLTNEKMLSGIEESIMELSGKYLDDNLDINDLTEITFTITDLSSEGVSFFRPLINTMNSAILGISSVDEKLERCMLSLTFDHRVTEGKAVAQFLKELKERIESYRAGALYRTTVISCFKCYTTLAEDLTDVGFASCIKPNGETGYICQRCFKGF